MADADNSLDEFLGQVVILDTQGPLLYIGQLHAIGAATVELRSADVHDIRDSRSSKDLYLVEARDIGVHVNRDRVLVMRSQVASVSLLKEVTS